jgi:hypothetical protein
LTTDTAKRTSSACDPSGGSGRAAFSLHAGRRKKRGAQQRIRRAPPSRCCTFSRARYPRCRTTPPRADLVSGLAWRSDDDEPEASTIMSKGMDSKKTTKKKPEKTLKEKRAAKDLKKKTK